MATTPERSLNVSTKDEVRSLKRKGIEDSPNREDAHILLTLSKSPKNASTPSPSSRSPFIKSSFRIDSPSSKRNIFGPPASVWSEEKDDKNGDKAYGAFPSPFPQTSLSDLHSKVRPSTHYVSGMAPSAPPSDVFETKRRRRRDEICADDIENVKKSIREKVKPCDSRIVENRGCHICHTRASKVILCCAKGFVSHSFCAAHVKRLWGHDLDEIEKNPSCFNICPVCSLECPCSACKRKLKKAVRKAVIGRSDDDDDVCYGESFTNSPRSSGGECSNRPFSPCAALGMLRMAGSPRNDRRCMSALDRALQDTKLRRGRKPGSGKVKSKSKGEKDTRVCSAQSPATGRLGNREWHPSMTTATSSWNANGSMVLSSDFRNVLLIGGSAKMSRESGLRRMKFSVREHDAVLSSMELTTAKTDASVLSFCDVNDVLNLTTCSRVLYAQSSSNVIWQRFVQANRRRGALTPFSEADTFESAWKFEFAMQQSIDREMSNAAHELSRLSGLPPTKPSRLSDALDIWRRIAMPTCAERAACIASSEILLIGAGLRGQPVLEKKLSRESALLLTFAMWRRHLRLASGRFSWLPMVKKTASIKDAESRLAVAAFLQCQHVASGSFISLDPRSTLGIDADAYRPLLSMLLSQKKTWSANGVPYERRAAISDSMPESEKGNILRRAGAILREMEPRARGLWLKSEAVSV